MSGSSALGGMDRAAKNMIKYSERNPANGIFDVIGHGSPHDIAGRSPSEIAEVSGGQDVRLLSCWTGSPAGHFAQELSNRLGVRVMAPATEIAASGSGQTLTFSTEVSGDGSLRKADAHRVLGWAADGS